MSALKVGDAFAGGEIWLGQERVGRVAERGRSRIVRSRRLEGLAGLIAGNASARPSARVPW